VINPTFLAPEEPIVRALAERARLSAADAAAVQARGWRSWRRCARRGRRARASMPFLREYHLASPEGVILMCLAEALLRIPDAHTADRLIADKIAAGAWEEHLGTASPCLSTPRRGG
jgi:RHH-type proline utilization regulon transcriptional repressor/proline dehydrogenase/delta 1-pyrroline-5-carboxylate dehydrogenase